MNTSVDLNKIKVACANCNLRELCMPLDLKQSELQRIDDLIGKRRKVARGKKLFNSGDKFKALFAVRMGFFKTQTSTEDAREQVMGFQMAGDLIGLDGIANDQHTCDAVALEDAEVCVIPFHQIEELSREITSLQRHLHNIMSREILRENSMMMLLGSMNAEERLATFLINLANRLHIRGFSSSELILRMSREEIGSYLGVQIETVSRTFKKMIDDGVVEVNRRHIRILNTNALTEIINNKNK